MIGPMAHEISTAALTAAAARHKDMIEALPTEEYGYSALADVIASFPETAEAFYEQLEAPEGGVRGGGATQFAMALLVADALGDSRAPTVIDGDLEIETDAAFTVYYGDLTVHGNLEFEGVLVVLGDLVVDGVLTDWKEWSDLWVTGNVRAKAAKLGCRAWAGGRLDAEFVLLSRWGALYAHEGVHASIALRNDYDGHGFLGPVHAEHQLDFEADEEAVVAALDPALFNDDGMIEDEDELVEAVVAGKSILR